MGHSPVEVQVLFSAPNTKRPPLGVSVFVGRERTASRVSLAIREASPTASPVRWLPRLPYTEKLSQAIAARRFCRLGSSPLLGTKKSKAPFHGALFFGQPGRNYSRVPPPVSMASHWGIALGHRQGYPAPNRSIRRNLRDTRLDSVQVHFSASNTETLNQAGEVLSGSGKSIRSSPALIM